MTDNELIDLEVERQVLIHTIKEMTKGVYCRMDLSKDEFISDLEKRVEEITEIIKAKLK